jgi:tRNA (guanine-N7-)-methyltransferase
MKTAKDLKIPFSWEERRPIWLDRFFYVPGVYDHKPTPQDWPKIFAIEYCSGNGQWIGEKAKQNPHLNWIAVEKRFDRARQIWLKMHRENIPNLFVVCSEAVIFTKNYAPKVVEQSYVNFPDPWPKRYHAKNRLVRAEFLTEVAKIAKNITCVTDDDNYAEFMAAEFQKCPDWRAHDSQIDNYGASFFGDLWKEKGRTNKFLTFERVK